MIHLTNQHRPRAVEEYDFSRDTVLVISPSSRITVQRGDILECVGFRRANILSGKSLAEIWEIAREICCGVSAIFTSASMGEDGKGEAIHFLNELRRNPKSEHPDLPVFFWDEQMQRDHVFTAIRAGVNGIIAPPVSPDVVANALRNHMLNNDFFVMSGGYTGPGRRGSRQKEPSANIEAMRIKKPYILTRAKAMQAFREIGVDKLAVPVGVPDSPKRLGGIDQQKETRVHYSPTNPFGATAMPIITPDARAQAPQAAAG